MTNYSQHYDQKYFDWQKDAGEFAGSITTRKLLKYIESSFNVVDFGCGGGYLINQLPCSGKIGIEINDFARINAKDLGVNVYPSSAYVPDNWADLIISIHALEHTLDPFGELKNLYQKLKPGRKIVFIVPSESVTVKYRADDINHHLFTWSPQCLGNLFSEAGFSVIECKAYLHKWPPFYRMIDKYAGYRLFELICQIYGHFFRGYSQVLIEAERPY